MKNSFGSSVTVTLFGESHGPEIGAVIDGLAPGIPVNEEYIRKKLAARRPAGKISTGRREPDNFRIVSGVYNGKTCGTPLCIIIPNTGTDSLSYEKTRGIARPGHADYTAYCKYHGFEDYRGGGHFSGRITAALVAAGAVIMQALEGRGIHIGTHILQCAGICDRNFCSLPDDIMLLEGRDFPVLDEAAAGLMKKHIEQAAAAGDSVGGVMETAVTGLPAGIGEPWFDSLEGVLSHALFSIPAVKGVEFGEGFAFAGMTGSAANDCFVADNGKIVTGTNRNGGINGGISNGMPVLFRCAVKPTPSIYKKQKTADFLKMENTETEITGRHDPCIVHRACAVSDAVTAVVIADMLAVRWGTDYLSGNAG